MSAISAISPFALTDHAAQGAQFVFFLCRVGEMTVALGRFVPVCNGQCFVLATDMVDVVEQHLPNALPFSSAKVFVHGPVESVARVVQGDHALMGTHS